MKVFRTIAATVAVVIALGGALGCGGKKRKPPPGPGPYGAPCAGLR